MEKITVRWTIWFVLLTVTLGCGSTQVQQLAIETIDNARVSISSAENVGARDVAVSEINSAEEMLKSADSSMQSGNVELAYRLGLRAYLYARIATEKSLAVEEETKVLEAQAQLELGQQATADVFNQLESLRIERDSKKQ
ncbi:MAG: DUF4398 domain-containing protein [Candidatus Poribacteria bacterium]|nr:DUF4398 domain-containing protein [Candidatus Poribacteria bacterium]